MHHRLGVQRAHKARVQDQILMANLRYGENISFYAYQKAKWLGGSDGSSSGELSSKAGRRTGIEWTGCYLVRYERALHP